ncbi:predicted protein [Arabidopsis lyrata subsp. lyrata]|uniref:Predicted protein n=1 Tax=Arabidopsis lyrata subsp. lyrata TaxID=81972 RepID=D7LHM7_ARALL|nr:predicted protein [Arabidopsis lyrata subsp. lyrata]
MLTRTSWSHRWCTVTRMRNVISARDIVYTINIGIGVTFVACILYTFCCVRTLVQTMLTRTSWSHRWLRMTSSSTFPIPYSSIIKSFHLL